MISVHGMMLPRKTWISLFLISTFLIEIDFKNCFTSIVLWRFLERIFFWVTCSRRLCGMWASEGRDKVLATFPWPVLSIELSYTRCSFNAFHWSGNTGLSHTVLSLPSVWSQDGTECNQTPETSKQLVFSLWFC